MIPDASTVEGWKNLLSFVGDNPHSDFYRTKYANAGFDSTTDFKTLDDVKKIPFITKTELTAVPSEKLRFVPESEILTLSITSGTTSGTSLLTYIAPSPLLHDVSRSEYVDHGTSLILFNAMRAGMMLHFYRLRNQLALLGDVHNLPASLALAAKAKVRTITTTPTLAIVLKKYIDAQPELLHHLKYIRLGGEVLK